MLKSLVIRLALRYGPEIIITLLKEFAKRTDNEVDNALVNVVERVLNKDPKLFDAIASLKRLEELKLWHNHNQ